MIPAVRFPSAAEEDLTAAFRRYKEQSVGLGTRLMARMDDLLARIAETPRQFPEILPGYRRALLQRFPCGIYFSNGPDEVVVHADLHLHRNPVHWQDRLTGGAG